jgi:hypothetical protein
LAVYGVDGTTMLIGHYVSRALYLAAKLGLADLLKDGPRNYRDLAKASETPSALVVFLDSNTYSRPPCH